MVKIIQKCLTQFDPKILTFMFLSTLDPKFGKKIFSLFFQIYNQGRSWEMFNWQLTDFYPDKKG